MEDLRETNVKDLLSKEGLRLREMAMRIQKDEGVNCFVDSTPVRRVMLDNLMVKKVKYWPIIFTRSNLAQAIMVVSCLLVHSFYCCFCVSEEIRKIMPNPILVKSKMVYHMCRAQLEC